MKELSTEEKAKAYDEAIERAKSWYVDAQIDFKKSLETLFPELKESEEDRIRKEIISHFTEIIDNIRSEEIIPHDAKVLVGKMQKWIAWLEKQGKQKQEIEGNPNARKPTLRIVKGKSYLCIKDYRDKNCTFTKGKIYKSDKDGFLVDDEEKNTFERKIWEEDAIEYFLLFEQSKTKDVVTDEKQTLADKVEPKFKKGDIIKEKETGNLFYVNSIEEFGYTLHYKNYIAKGCTMEFKYEDNYELVEQKPAWSEEDEEHLNSIIGDIKTNMGAYPRSQEVIDIYNDDISFLKSLKDRVLPQPRQEWSEEDKQMSNIITSDVLRIRQKCGIGTDEWYIRSKALNWLEFLKERVQPQSQWKPSDEQLRELRCVISGCSFETPILVELEEQLKKL